MIINLNNQQFCINDIDVLTISASSTFQVGDNETVVLTSFREELAEGHQFGPFPMYLTPTKFKTSVTPFNIV